MKIGPDGAIYVCDWYNPIIGHYQASFRHPDRDKTHGRIWRITCKDRPLVKPPKIAGAPLEELFENLKSGERWVREMTRLELMGRKTEEVVKVALKWGQSQESSLTELKSTRRNRYMPDEGEIAEAVIHERALMELLNVLEAHGSSDAGPIALALADKAESSDIRAYAAGFLSRSYELKEISATALDNMLSGLARDPVPRVRLAVVVSAGDIPLEASILAAMQAEYVAIGFDHGKPDKFEKKALESAVPKIAEVILKAKPTEVNRSDEVMGFIKRYLPEAPSKSLPAQPSAKSADKISATVPATGKLRATPEFVAVLVKEVRESGDAKHGGEVYRRAELTCTACHSIADQGGRIGPPLDAVGSRAAARLHHRRHARAAARDQGKLRSPATHHQGRPHRPRLHRRPRSAADHRARSGDGCGNEIRQRRHHRAKTTRQLHAGGPGG